MGDHADDALNDALDFYWEMDDEWAAWTEEDEYYLGSARKDKVCKYCQQTGLHWILIESGWRLANAKNEIHNCLKLSPKSP